LTAMALQLLAVKFRLGEADQDTDTNRLVDSRQGQTARR
jgi:hypothetical protein